MIAARPRPLTWIHVGDLHLKDQGAQNQRDFERVVAAAAALPRDSVDFVLLPGDNADDGTPAQFGMVRDGLLPLELPVHILPGDHDFAPGNLNAFHLTLGARTLPYASVVRGHRCLFLDVVSTGSGGPDFRLGRAQLDWAEREVEHAAAAGQDVAIFMHTYPADLREGAERIGALLAFPHVTCVDMGHTHYNELANDGRTIFMATRSTGQIEEGPAGFSVAAVDHGCVSWRFKTLERPWPLVMVTRPADRRLTTERSRAADPATVRAVALSDAPIAAVTVVVDGRPALAMTPVEGEPGLWQADVGATPQLILVHARDGRGREDHDRIDLASPNDPVPTRAADGSDRDSVGAWPERGIVGGQLGPNRNGRKW